MYIRWKDKPRRPDYEPSGRGWNSRTKPVTLYVAYLVESHRVNGKPRQTTQYLASIQDKQICEMHFCAGFWSRALAKLQNLQISSGERERLETALSQRVPRPTNEQIKREQEAREVWLRSITAKLKRRL